jgi:DNA-binding GntR family transcriptional regulator
MSSSDAAVTRTDHAHDRIRADILSGRIAPGAPLRLAAIAGDLSVSMSVVREALTRLAGQGLVTATPNPGFRVIPLSREDLLDLTSLRVMLECRALESSVAAGDVRWEGDVVSAHHVLERTPISPPGHIAASEEWMRAHATFHDALVAECGSPRLLALVRSLRDSTEIYRQWSGPIGAERGRDILGEHRALMELATARRASEASEALRAHIQCTTDLLLVGADRLGPTESRPAKEGHR